MNILINGASGKMGNELFSVIKESKEFNVICGVDIKENLEGEFPIYSKIEDIKEKIDVIIDFSVPVATFKILKYAVANKVPIVIATTGFSKEEIEQIEEFSKEIPIFRSSNMSFDINLMAKIVAEVAKVLTNTDIEIVETHHNRKIDAPSGNRKIDAPSGTAILLANAINDVLDEKKEYNFERLQKREKRSKNEIGFSSIRGGNIVGEHSVKFFGENEEFEITHKAYSRKVFAEGALKVAKFIVTKETGLYNMNDIF